MKARKCRWGTHWATTLAAAAAAVGTCSSLPLTAAPLSLPPARARSVGCSGGAGGNDGGSVFVAAAHCVVWREAEVPYLVLIWQ